MANNNPTLHNAKTEKSDEFYTMYEDIAKEIVYYTDYLKDKVIYCNCDDPFKSNFVRYFVVNFHAFGLKRLIATCFKDEEKKGFNFGHRKYAKGTFLDYHGEIGEEEVADSFFEKLKPYCKPMKGNGDFRSEESIELLKEADIVVTNPPFSLFREFIHTLEEYGKKYIVVGNKNAVTYKEVFPLIKEDRLWIGVASMKTNFIYHLPDSVAEDMVKNKKNKSAYYIVSGEVMGRAPSCWFTNLDHKKRHEGIYLTKKYDPSVYPTYDNYDAIEVSKVADIPMDYDGIMGVPITFVDKFNPEQFEIRGSTTRAMINGKNIYTRIFIKRRPEWNQDEHF